MDGDSPPVKKKAPKAPKVGYRVGKPSTRAPALDQATYEAEKEEELRAIASAYHTTGRGAQSEEISAQMAKTAAKAIKDFEEHKAAKLAARDAGQNGGQTRINFAKFLAKLKAGRTGRGKAAKAANAAEVLKKSVAKKL